MRINDADTLDQIHQELDQIDQELDDSIPDVKKALRPIRSNVTLEDIKREQNYTPLDYNEFMDLADKVGLEEPIEELLEMLTK